MRSRQGIVSTCHAVKRVDILAVTVLHSCGHFFIHAKTAWLGQHCDNHEIIVANMARVLSLSYYDQPDMRVMESNNVVYIPAYELAVNPDVLVVQGESQLFPRKRRAAGILNPYLLVKVRSESTAERDSVEKLPCYKKIDSAQHTLYIDQDQHYVTVYTKNRDSYYWFNNDYDRLDRVVGLPGLNLPLAEIYHKVAFAKPVRQSISPS